MKLTKEECLDALTELSVYAKYIANKAEISSLFECYERLEQLINEHFDNPPLKFEELKPKMWVWDNKYKVYNKIMHTTTFFDERTKAVEFEYLNETTQFGSMVEFEENRYYRKQVQE